MEITIKANNNLALRIEKQPFFIKGESEKEFGKVGQWGSKNSFGR